MVTICESGMSTQSVMGVNQEKWLNYSKVYAKNRTVTFDELGLLTNGKKREGPGGSGDCSASAPIYPSNEAAEVLYANMTSLVPIQLTSEPCTRVIPDYLIPHSHDALNHYKLGVGDGSVFEGYVKPKGKGKWVYVTPTKEIPFKECWIRLNKVDGGVVGGAVQQKLQQGAEDNAIIGQSSQTQTKKQSSILQFFSKIPSEAWRKAEGSKNPSPKIRVASSRKKRKCTQMQQTPLSKPRRKIPRRKMTWSPIKEISSSSSSTPSAAEEDVIPESQVLSMPQPLTPYKVLTPPRVKTDTVLIEDSQTDPVLQMIKTQLTRTKLLREKYSRMFDVVHNEENAMPISELRNRFHRSISTSRHIEKGLEAVDQVDELPEDVLLDIFSLEKNSKESVQTWTPNCICSIDILFGLVPDDESIGALVSLEEDFKDMSLPFEVEDDLMDSGFSNLFLQNLREEFLI